MRDGGTIVLVDDEEVLVDSLTAQLSALRPRLRIHATTSPHEAELFVRRHQPDVLVSDVRMPEMSGVDLVAAVRAIRPTLPIIFMTAFSIQEAQVQANKLTALTFLEKPFSAEALATRIDELCRRQSEGSFSGAISVDTLSDVVQLYMLSNTRGMLEVQHREDRGCIWIDRGSVVHAECGALRGAEAFYRVLGWRGGSFALHSGVAAEMRTIHDSATALMLESCRRRDEAEADAGWGALGEEPRTEPRWSWQPPPMISEEPREDARVLNLDCGTPKGMENHMSNARESLAKLNEIDGFIGAALVDSESGMMLGAEGGGALNLEIAAAGNTEVVRAKRKVAKALNLRDDIEDILISLGKQYHVIRPLRSKPGVFFYLAVDRARANLAMARLKLADVEKDLVI